MQPSPYIMNKAAQQLTIKDWEALGFSTLFHEYLSTFGRYPRKGAGVTSMAKALYKAFNK